MCNESVASSENISIHVISIHLDHKYDVKFRLGQLECS